MEGGQCWGDCTQFCIQIWGIEAPGKISIIQLIYLFIYYKKCTKSKQKPEIERKEHKK